MAKKLQQDTSPCSAQMRHVGLPFCFRPADVGPPVLEYLRVALLTVMERV